MLRRLWDMMCGVSAALFAFTMVLAFLAPHVYPRYQRLSLSEELHVSLIGPRGDDVVVGRVVVFNQPYGPYMGGIIALSDGRGNSYPPLEWWIGWGDSWGVYYRDFKYDGGAAIWTLMVSLWYPLLLFGAMPAVWLAHRHKTRPRGFLLSCSG